MAEITPRQWRDKLRRITDPANMRRIGQTLYEAGDMVAVDAAISITTGAVSGKNHVPSLPGEPPNADTHVLDRSIETELVKGGNAGELRVEVSANAPYAKDLEDGNSKMAERPFMKPALAKNRRKAVRMVRETVRQILKEV